MTANRLATEFRFSARSHAVLVGVSLLFVALGAMLLTQAAPAPPPRARIDAGALQGVREGPADEVLAFKGVPYAAPPMQGWRWKPPRPSLPWTGVRLAHQVGPACPQSDRGVVIQRRLTSSFGGDPSEVVSLGATSEDCLSLNVRTTNLGERARQPVMVWLHGGAFSYGRGGSEPARLATLGVVVVTINYRLGLLGSLAHPALARESPHDSSGTYGLLDQIDALRWVRRNVSQFGGDPDRVTVFGQSAGGAAVLQLIASPLAKGLMHRAIVQSGGLGESRPRVEAEGKGRQIVDGLVGALAAPLPALRRVSTARLIAAGGGPFDPVTDGWVLPRAVPTALLATDTPRVPLLVGATANEAVVFPIPKDLNAYRGLLAEAGPVWEPRLSDLYPAKTDDEAYDALLHFVTDRDFVCPSRYLAAQRPAPTWLYRVSVPAVSTGAGHRLGAFHGSDVRYLFGSDFGVPLGGSAEKVGNAMRRYWVRFATTGDPNDVSLPAWPIYAAARPMRMEFGDPIAVVSAGDDRRCEVFDEISDARYAIAGAARR